MTTIGPPDPPMTEIERLRAAVLQLTQAVTLLRIQMDALGDRLPLGEAPDIQPRMKFTQPLVVGADKSPPRPLSKEMCARADEVEASLKAMYERPPSPFSPEMEKRFMGPTDAGVTLPKSG